mmetsp:Transcript_9223/g.19956  ORF Transcript_9223/g.19956 Transcript_9223/m.19956 type:complete len:86 (-) Transcript_9223:298-555(-)
MVREQRLASHLAMTDMHIGTQQQCGWRIDGCAARGRPEKYLRIALFSAGFGEGAKILRSLWKSVDIMSFVPTDGGLLPEMQVALV